jgi:hypothetical protein
VTRSDTYVLVQTDVHTGPIAGSLLDLPGVISAEDVRGPYDAVVLARPNGAVRNVEGIVEEIRRLPGVLHALAAPLVRSNASTESPGFTVQVSRSAAEVPSLTAA